MMNPPDLYYRVGERAFYWLGERRRPGMTMPGRLDALEAAAAESARTGDRIEVWSRTRMNDYVRSWGEIRHVRDVIVAQPKEGGSRWGYVIHSEPHFYVSDYRYGTLRSARRAGARDLAAVLAAGEGPDPADPPRDID